jgi:hypothetical protein
MEITFISGKFCHRDIYLTRGFAAPNQGVTGFPAVTFRRLPKPPLLVCRFTPSKRAAPSLRFELLLVRFFMPERIQKPVEPAPWGPKQGDGGGPRSPDVSRPDTKDLLKKMRKVDPNQSKRYRQRTGQ